MYTIIYVIRRNGSKRSNTRAHTNPHTREHTPT